jgi:hypothetical protein
MTATPQTSAVTFTLAANRLMTLRYDDPVPFRAFTKRRQANLSRYHRGPHRRRVRRAAQEMWPR